MIFPNLNLDDVINTINQEQNNNVIEEVILLEFKKNNAYIVMQNGKPKTTTDLKEKIQMYLQVLLRTELDIFEIYKGTDFGMTYFDWLGKRVPAGILISELEREITDHLNKMNVFDHLENFKAEFSFTSFYITFDIILTDGKTLVMEVI